MLRLSKKADYALIAMKHLAHKDSGATSTSAREIAEQYDIPIELMAKVLQRLVRTGLLVSTQGTRGGYTLEPAVGLDQRRRRGRSDRRSVHRDGLLVGQARLRAVRQVQRARAAVADSRADRGDARHGDARGYGSGSRANICCACRRRATGRVRHGRDEASDLHGLPRHDARRSTGARGDDAVLHAALRQRRQPQPLVRLGGRGGGGDCPQAGRRSDWRQREGNHLHERRDRVEQPGDQGRRGDVPREGQPHHHLRDRAQGGDRHVQEAREAGRARHLSAGAEGRPHQPRRAARRDHRQDDPHHDHDREQRDRRAAADRGDRRDREGEGDPVPHRRACRRSARCRSTSTT